MGEKIIENKNPLVSIVVPSFNSGKNIERTIQSVINQTYSNIQLIIIDGGSVDNTLDIIKVYQDKIDYWVSEKDEGVYNAFNKGVKQSDGELIGTINSDDWYEPDTMETIVNLYKDIDVDFYVGAVRFWQDEKRSIVKRPDRNYRKKVKYSMPKIHQEALFVKSSVYNEIGFYNENLKYTGDHEFFLRLVIAGKKGHLFDKVIANHIAGGITDLKAPFAYREIVDSCPRKIRAFFWFLFASTKFYMRKMLGFIAGGNKLIHFLRKIKYQ